MNNSPLIFFSNCFFKKITLLRGSEVFPIFKINYIYSRRLPWGPGVPGCPSCPGSPGSPDCPAWPLSPFTRPSTAPGIWQDKQNITIRDTQIHLLSLSYLTWPSTAPGIWQDKQNITIRDTQKYISYHPWHGQVALHNTAKYRTWNMTR